MSNNKGVTQEQIAEEIDICQSMVEQALHVGLMDAHSIWLHELAKRGYCALANELDEVVKPQLLARVREHGDV